ncbi:MAG: patatin-like phospholipase family protein [Halobacteriota archaeon]
MPTGIVLGGGGTLGDFQVGALIFLYKKGVLPNIKCVCGTSIGAINAVIVSTGEGCDDRLERYWSEDVIGREDLIPQHKWSENIAPMLKTFMIAEKHSKFPLVGQIRVIGRIRAISAFIQESKEDSLRDIVSGIDDFEDMLGTAARESALYTADKLKQRMLDKIDDIEKALDPEIVFSLYATNVETGQKTCFSNNKKLRGTIDDTLYVPCQSSDLLVQAALASAAVPPLFPPVEVCESYYIDGAVREVVPVKGAIESGADTIYAILCLPRFAHRRKYAFLDVKGEGGEKKSTDWGTSNLFDVRPEDWVVNNRNWDPKSDECDVLDIANRTAALIIDELTEGDLTSTDDTGKKIEPKVIDPLIPVHGWTQLNIGLLKINADQGYMRAFDVVCAPKSLYEQCEQLTAEITSRRIKIWTLEHQLIEEWSEVRDKSPFAERPPLDVPYAWRVLYHWCANVVDTTILYDIRQKKKELKVCIEKRLAIVESSSLSDEDKKRSLPDDYVKMYLCWEPHNWDLEGRNKKPLIPTPWHQLDLRESGSDVIEEDWSFGHPPVDCEKRSLLRYFGET